MNRLTATDALFAFVDTETAPMNMGSVLILRPPANRKGDFFNSFQQFVADRMEYLPKLKKRLAVDPIGLPHWLDCKGFELDYHVNRIKLRSDDEMALFEELGRLQHLPFDRKKPLFMFYVIEGLQDGKIAIMQKFHHAFADGKTAVRVMDLFSDEGLERASDQSDLDDSGSPGLLKRVATGYVEDLRRTVSSLPGVGGAARRMIGEGGKEMLERLKSRPVTVFNKPLTEKRLFAFRHWPLAELTRVRRAAGLTFVDLGLALLGGALRRYLEEENLLPDKSLVCNVPVALDVAGSKAGNAVLAIWVPIGTHMSDRKERIRYMKNEMDDSKKFLSGVLEGAAAGSGIQLPSYLIRAMAMQMKSPLMARLNPPPGNIALSSVPAPSNTMHVAGAEVESLYGMPMVLQGQAVSTTFSSYDDKVVISALCDKQALPDPQRIFDYMEDELGEIAALYGLAKAKRRPAPAGRKKTAKSAARKKAAMPKAAGKAKRKVARKRKSNA